MSIEKVKNKKIEKITNLKLLHHYYGLSVVLQVLLLADCPLSHYTYLAVFVIILDVVILVYYFN